MSQVETNKTSPSIATLENIAEALEVPLAYLLLKKEERMQTSSGPDELKVSHLATTKHVRMMIVEIPPGSSTGEKPRAHEGEEVHLVMKGQIFAEQGEEGVILTEGDSFSWNACTPHKVKNIGEETALIMISVYTDEPQDWAAL